MQRFSVTLVAAIAALAFAACSKGHSTLYPTTPPPGGQPQGKTVRACAETPGPGYVRCYAIIRTDVQPIKPLSGRRRLDLPPPGYGPPELQSAYNIPSANGGGHTVAIVDAFDDPNAEDDLAVYRSQFGLPDCTTANGCFRKLNQDGLPGPYPLPNAGWAAEISLDVDMVSAICPNCNIVLVESNTNSFSNIVTAEDTAASIAGIDAISNSYGASEFFGEVTFESHYNHPGMAITVSSGDSGYRVEYPAASQYVTAVGGTSLYADSSSSRGWFETAWSGAGSGCSAVIAKPSWQADPLCAFRTVADVSAVADPFTGVAVYDTYNPGGPNGWFIFGGTSVSAPIIGAVYALAGNGGSIDYGSFSYSHLDQLNDVLFGANGLCGLTYLCYAGPGYDGPTGNGTPNGTGAF